MLSKYRIPNPPKIFSKTLRAASNSVFGASKGRVNEFKRGRYYNSQPPSHPLLLHPLPLRPFSHQNESQNPVDLLSHSIVESGTLTYKIHERPEINLQICGYPLAPLDDTKRFEESSAYSAEEVETLRDEIKARIREDDDSMHPGDEEAVGILDEMVEKQTEGGLSRVMGDCLKHRPALIAIQYDPMQLIHWLRQLGLENVPFL